MNRIKQNEMVVQVQEQSQLLARIKILKIIMREIKENLRAAM